MGQEVINTIVALVKAIIRVLITTAGKAALRDHIAPYLPEIDLCICLMKSIFLDGCIPNGKKVCYNEITKEKHTRDACLGSETPLDVNIWLVSMDTMKNLGFQSLVDKYENFKKENSKNEENQKKSTPLEQSFEDITDEALQEIRNLNPPT